MKAMFLLTAVLVVSQCLTDKEILQQGLNGVFEQNKLADPKTIVQCFDDAAAHLTVVFIGQLLQKAAKGSLKDLLSLKSLIQKFVNDLPSKVKDCLDGNKQFQSLGLKYGIDNTTNGSKLQEKIIAYVTLHYFQVHKEFGTLNDFWKTAKYYKAGFEAGIFGHKVLKISQKRKAMTDREILQNLINGGFKQNKMEDPKGIVQCLDDSTAHASVGVIGTVFDKGATGGLSDIPVVLKLIRDFLNSIPADNMQCLMKNPELAAIGLVYGIKTLDDLDKLQKKLILYGTLHFLQVHREFGILNNYWNKQAKYYQTGFQGAKYLHKAIRQNRVMTDQEILQAALKGNFEQNGLPQPKTVFACIDDKTAKLTVAFIGTFLNDSANAGIGDAARVINDIKDWLSEIPDSVFKCLDGNKQIEAFNLKYGIDNNTQIIDIEIKILAYVLQHFLEVHFEAVFMDNTWNAENKYYDTGFEGAKFLHKLLPAIFEMGQQKVSLSDRQILQQTVNGNFEQNSLPDSKTILPCLDDDTAHNFVVFIGKFLNDASKAGITDISKIINEVLDFGKSIPESVGECLDGNQELKTIGKKYGITESTDPSDIEKQLIAYATFHYFEVHQELGTLSMMWNINTKYYDMGFQTAKYLHKVLSITAEDIAQLRILK